MTRRSSLKEEYAAQRDRLADAARDGDWRTVLGIVDEQRAWVNTARLEGRSGYTPLHQAAWHGARAETVGRLLEAGGWRTLRTGDGARAVDIAAQRGHHHLTSVLCPDLRQPLPADVVGRLQYHLHRLIRHRAGAGDGSDLTTEHAMRLPEVEVLTELRHPVCWFPVPGMYGGFKIRLSGGELTVDSWVRIVGGSERKDVVTVDGVNIQEGGQL